MIKDLNIVHYKNICYNIFLSDNKLFINEGNNIRVIDKGVLIYTLNYSNDLLWICYYNINNSIFIIEFNLKNKIERRIYYNNLLSHKNCIKNIDSLNLFVNEHDNIQIVFRGWSDYSKIGLIFHCNVTINSSINVIASSHCASYNKPFTVCKVDDNILILICENFSRGEYILYDPSVKNNVARLFLPNINNVYLVNYNNKLLIFYNKLHKKDLSMNYREIIGTHSNGHLENEYSLPLCGNILNPNISTYMGKIYIVWSNNNSINMAVSSNLKTWKYTYVNRTNNSDLAKATINKATSHGCETLKTYVNISKAYSSLDYFKNNKNEKLQGNVINNYESLKQMYEKISFEYRLREQILYEKYLNAQIKNLEQIKKTEKYYKGICNNYLNTISKLMNSLEEKDNIINSLLNIVKT